MKLILMMLLTIVSVSLYSQTSEEVSFPVSERTKSHMIGKYLYVYEDMANSLKIEDVSNPSFSDKFLLNSKETVNRSYTESSIWIKLNLERESYSESRFLMEISYPHLDHIEVYCLKNGYWEREDYGDRIPFSTRKIKSRNFVIPGDFGTEQRISYYFRIRTDGLMIVPVSVYTYTDYLNSSSAEEAVYILFYGMMLIMIFYNGFICIAFRSVAYLLYCISTFLTMMFYLSFYGHGFQFVWGNSIWWQNYSAITVTGFAWIFTLAFTHRFLDIKNSHKYLHRIYVGLSLFILLAFCCFFHSKQLMLLVQNFYGISAAFFAFTAGLISLFKGYKAARFFVIGWATFLIGAVLFILHVRGIFEKSYFIDHIMQIGTVIELALLSLALADRYKFIQDENIRVHKENSDLERKAKEELEGKVKERTLELNKNLELIEADLAMAKKIQSYTLSSDLSKIQELEIAIKYNAMNKVGGDFYHIRRLNEKTVRFFLADATGHGVQAAMITMAIQGIYDGIKNYELQTNQIMEIFNNEFIRRYGQLNSFLTCILLDIHTDSGKVIYSSAGHPSAFLLKEKDFELLPKTGPLVGFIKGQSYKIRETVLESSSRLYIYTDGIFEEFLGGQEYGEERLYQVLLKARNENMESAISKVFENLREFLNGTEFQDDIAIIGIEHKRKNTDNPSAFLSEKA